MNIYTYIYTHIRMQGGLRFDRIDVAAGGARRSLCAAGSVQLAVTVTNPVLILGARDSDR